MSWIRICLDSGMLDLPAVSISGCSLYPVKSFHFADVVGFFRTLEVTACFVTWTSYAQIRREIKIDHVKVQVTGPR